ncbi:MAG: hypothetical protein SFW36_12295, partial [Leptolyngbyaceae cyanobacterium bins.59]|nr:hypothetical protein [Leptolyngbyaceae cyanobacterium bins.59]
MRTHSSSLNQSAVPSAPWFKAKVWQDWLPTLIFAAGLLLPLLWVVIHGYTLTGQYEESLGYRYFYSLRQLYDADRYVFLPQAQLVDLTHRVIQLFLSGVGYAIDDSSQRIEVFSYLSLLVAHGAAIAAFQWAIQPLVSLRSRLGAALFWLLIYYPPGIAGIYGFYAILQPDYPVWVIWVGLLMAGFYTRWPAQDSEWSYRDALWLGLFAGLALSVKLTLTLFPIAIGLGWFITQRNWLRSLLMGSLTALTTGGVFLLVLLLLYQGNLSHLQQFFADLRIFGQSVGSQEPYWQWLMVTVPRSPWRVGLSVIAPLIFLGLLPFAQNRSQRGVLAGLVVSTALYHLILYSRYVTVTWSEAATLFQAGLWAIVVLFPIPWHGVAWTWAGVAGLGAAIAVGLPSAQYYLNEVQVNTHAQQQMQQILSRREDRIAFLFPGNDMRPFTIDSGIWKGGINFLVHDTFGDSPLLRQMFPFRQYFNQPDPAFYQKNPVNLIEFGAVVIPVQRRAAQPPIAEQVQKAEQHFSTSLSNFRCDFELTLNSGQNLIVCLRHLPASQMSNLDQEFPDETGVLEAFYQPQVTNLAPGVSLLSPTADLLPLQPGAMVLSGTFGELRRLRSDNTVVTLTAREGQQIRLINVGNWDEERKILKGLMATYQQRRWVIDASPLQPFNPNPNFQDNTDQNLLPGMTLTTNAKYELRVMRDEERPFLRVRLWQPVDQLMLVGIGPLQGLPEGPIALRAQLRSNNPRQLKLNLFDISNKNGHQLWETRQSASQQWRSLTVQ